MWGTYTQVKLEKSMGLNIVPRYDVLGKVRDERKMCLSGVCVRVCAHACMCVHMLIMLVCVKSEDNLFLFSIYLFILIF